MLLVDTQSEFMDIHVIPEILTSGWNLPGKMVKNLSLYLMILAFPLLA